MDSCFISFRECYLQHIAHRVFLYSLPKDMAYCAKDKMKTNKNIHTYCQTTFYPAYPSICAAASMFFIETRESFRLMHLVYNLKDFYRRKHAQSANDNTNENVWKRKAVDIFNNMLTTLSDYKPKCATPNTTLKDFH